MPGLMSGDWKRGTVSGPQRLQPDAWTAPGLAATAPAPGSAASNPRAPDARAKATPHDRSDPVAAGAELASTTPMNVLPDRA
jgi:hypothetical protein